jgi:G protein beta subunit-like protein
MDDSEVIFVTGGYDHSIKFWRPQNGVCYRSASHSDSQINALAITPDKRFVASAGYQHIRMYEVNSSETSAVYDYEGVSKNITCVGFVNSGIWMFSGGEDKTARIWDLRSHGLQCNRSFMAPAQITSMCLHPNQCVLVIGDQKGNIVLWDLTSNQSTTLVTECDVAVNTIDIDPAGTYLAAGNSKGLVYIWRLTAGSTTGFKTLQQEPVKVHSRYVLKCAFSPDSSLLATTSADSTIKIWTTADFSLRNVLKRTQEKWVWDCTFAQDSQHLFTGKTPHDNIVVH